MVRATQFAPPVQQKSILTTVPAPVGGLNARDALASMPPTQAVILENYFPTRSGVMVRPGWNRYYYDIPDSGAVETIIKYNAPDGVEKIFACANGSFIDASAGGAYSASDVKKSGFSNDRWQYVQLANVTGDFTVAVNGADTPQFYNGTTWADCVITADMGLFPWFDSKNFISVTQMHRRLWFVEKDSARVWYLPVDVVQGEVSLFDCGEVFPLGGYCQTCLSWSVDTGAGMDDQSVFLSSKGNIAVFTGFDPDAGTGTEGAFTLSGVYTIGATVGRRCACPYGSDVLILCEDGVVSLTSVLSQSKMLMQPPISDIIQHALSQVVDEFSGLFGWDLFTSARHNQLYLNVPDTSQQYQFVMNTILDAWCTLKGYVAWCWENFYEEPYFGGNGYVARAWNDNGVDDPLSAVTDIRVTSDGDTRVTSDGDVRVTLDVATTQGGTSIQARCLQAFNYFGSPQQKSWSLARPVFLADGEPVSDVFFNTDFEIVENASQLPSIETDDLSTIWDEGFWDVGEWSGELRTWKRWYGLNNVGFSGAIFLRTATVFPTTWLATDFQLHRGGTL